MRRKDLDIVTRLKNESDLSLEKARKLEEDEDFTGIEATQNRFYEEGYRDALAEVWRELLQGGE